MPPCDAPILTGGDPLPGSADINALACIIVKWQALYSVADNGADAARLRQICGTLPTALPFRAFASRACAIRAPDVALPSFGIRAENLGEDKMAWKAPKIVEVPVGMEINMYACAARK